MRIHYWPAVLLLGSGVLAASETWNFDQAATGKLAPGWRNESGTWKVVADPTAPSKPNVLAQVSKEHTGSTFNVAVADQSSLKDVTITVRVRSVAGQEDQGGGPVWRYRDLKNYYIARENALEDNYRVYRVVNGRRIQIASADVDLEAGPWHTLKVTMVGDYIQCFLNGKKYLDVRDSTFGEAGRVGLWTKADAQTQFDDFTASGM